MSSSTRSNGKVTRQRQIEPGNPQRTCKPLHSVHLKPCLTCPSEGVAALAAYHKRIKGKPVNKPATPAPKRGRKRKSPPAESIPDLQSSANNKKRKSNGPTAVELGLPTGSWEDDIESIINMEQQSITVRGKQEEDLLCYVKWNDGRKITHSVITLRQKCPQKVLFTFSTLPLSHD